MTRHQQKHKHGRWSSPAARSPLRHAGQLVNGRHTSASTGTAAGNVTDKPAVQKTISGLVVGADGPSLSPNRDPDIPVGLFVVQVTGLPIRITFSAHRLSFASSAPFMMRPLILKHIPSLPCCAVYSSVGSYLLKTRLSSPKYNGTQGNLVELRETIHSSLYGGIFSFTILVQGEMFIIG